MKIDNDQLIVITGGAGFIGSCMVRYLNDKGMRNIIIVDDLGKTEKWKNLVGKKFVDIVSRHQLFNWLEGKQSEIEAFIHLGACSDTMETDATYLLDNNFRYTVRLAEYALKHDHRFIYASSASTYGDGSKGFVDNEDDIYSLQPLNMYGFSKQLVDQWALDQGVLNKLIGLKYFNVFGPNEAHKGRMCSAVWNMVPQILKEGKVRLFKSSNQLEFADGEQNRDFLYVKDAVAMTYAFLMLNDEGRDIGGIYNIGSGKASTWNQLANAVFKALGRAPQIEYIKMPEHLEGKYQNRSEAKMDKTESMINGATTCQSLEDSVGDYVQNYIIPGKIW